MTPAEKLLVDELCAARASSAELMQRLSLAHSALHTERDAHEQTKAALHSLQRGKPSPVTSVGILVLDEIHDFQRFEHVTLHPSGNKLSSVARIICRCGWGWTLIDRDPDEAVAIAAAKALLQAHITETAARIARVRAGTKP